MATIEERIADLDFYGFLRALYDGGWYEFVFPFLLVYAIVFTVLNYVTVFEGKKPVKAVIALVLALFSIAFPITGEGDCFNCQKTLADFMMVLFPGVTAFSIGILALYIVAAMLGVNLLDFFGEGERNNLWIRVVLGGIGLIFVFYYFGLGFEWFDNDFSNSDFWLWELIRDPLLYVLIVFGLFFWWISGDDLTPEERAGRENQRRRREANYLQERLDRMNRNNGNE
jgi:hypothetical protein